MFVLPILSTSSFQWTFMFWSIFPTHNTQFHTSCTGRSTSPTTSPDGPEPATAPMSKEDKRMQFGADADQMFGKNRMKEDGFVSPVTGRLRTKSACSGSTTVARRRGEMQSPPAASRGTHKR